MYMSSYYHFLLVLQFFALFTTNCRGEGFPASFTFGDSLVDTGNNNYIVSLSKANAPPYGIDFGSASGRYTNGRTIIDIIGQELGTKGFNPPYLAPTTVGDVLLHGVNYASGAGGILNKTGYIFVGRLNMDAQLDNYANTRQDIISRIGSTAASKLLSKSLFSIVLGSNDFLDNYLISVEQKYIPPEKFVDILISKYRLQLTRLYELDARKIAVSNVGPIGCIPFQRDLNPSAGESCVTASNELAMLFNKKLKRLIIELNSNLVGSIYLYANAYRVVSDIIQNFQSYGFENFNSACCYLSGRFGGLGPCALPWKVCANRSKYVFWDAYHPSEAANVIIAKRFLDGDTNDIYPMNVRQLMKA